MDIESHLQQIDQNWHQREHNCATCPKWHTGGFKRPFFGASLQDTLEAKVVFVGIEPGTRGAQAHEEWREEEEVSISEAADRISDSEWEQRDYPLSSAAMFNRELLKIIVGKKTLSDSIDTESFKYYITNLEKCHEEYGIPDEDKYDMIDYLGDETYNSEYDAEATAIDCCFSYFTTELDLLEPEVVVALGGDARDYIMDRFPGFGARPRLTKDPFTILESDSVEWKLVPAMHPSDRNLNGSYSFDDVVLPDSKNPTNSEDARRVYFDILHQTIIQEINN